MSALAAAPRHDLGLEEFGALTPVARAGGQGRVHRPAFVPRELLGGPVGPDLVGPGGQVGVGGRVGPGGEVGPVVVKLYHRPPPSGAVDVLSEMVAWGASLEPERRAALRRAAAWPLATVSSSGRLAGVAMQDVSARFSTPFLMPSGRAQPVLLALEHLLGGDWYLERRGLPVYLNTATRVWAAERISATLAFLHQQAIVVGDLAPSNLLIAFRRMPEVCFIDCDSMVFRGRRALTSVETGDWNVPFDEPPGTRAADAYKLGLVVLRLFARSHDARAGEPHMQHVPAPLRPLLVRALGPDPANRPPAGEWQRALAHVYAAGGLNEGYPGPALRPPPPPPRPPRRPADAPVRVPAFQAGSGRRLSPALWIALFLVVLLLMSRLLAALPSPHQPTFSPSGAGRQPGGQYYFVVPSGPGQR